MNLGCSPKTITYNYIYNYTCCTDPLQISSSIFLPLHALAFCLLCCLCLARSKCQWQMKQLILKVMRRRWNSLSVSAAFSVSTLCQTHSHTFWKTWLKQDAPLWCLREMAARAMNLSQSKCRRSVLLSKVCCFCLTLVLCYHLYIDILFAFRP